MGPRDSDLSLCHLARLVHLLRLLHLLSLVHLLDLLLLLHLASLQEAIKEFTFQRDKVENMR